MFVFAFGQFEYTALVLLTTDRVDVGSEEHDFLDVAGMYW